MSIQAEQSGLASFKNLMLPSMASAISGIIFSFTPEKATYFDLLTLMLCAAWALSNLWILIFAAIRLKWRRCLHLIIILLVSAPLCVLARMAGDYLHLALMWPKYQSKIQASESSRVDFLWGYYGSALSSTQRILIYDSNHDRPAPESWRRLVGNFYIYEEYF